MSYTFKPSSEFAWFVLTAVVMAIAQVLLTLEPTEITDWRVWLVSLIGATVRAAAGAVISYIGSQREQARP